MINFRQAKIITIIGGGTAGWFAALSLRKFFASSIKIQLIESPKVGIEGGGEGGLINLIGMLNHLKIPTSEFMQETGATLNWGFCYEGWRTGEKKDVFYHPFVNVSQDPFQQEYVGVMPCISGLISHKIPIAYVVKDFDKIINRVSQGEAIDALISHSGLISSFHFDSQRAVDFLKRIACEQGVEYIEAHVQSFKGNKNGYINKITTDKAVLDTDFIIDASGFARVVIGKKLKSKWCSFKEYLWLDKVLSFQMSHHGQVPELVTRATAMKAGWMWRIPLAEHIDAGYVYSSQFTTEKEAVAEIEEYLGEKIVPLKTSNFEAGHFEEVWKKNVMALGRASGFVEPLEATLNGQMLEQLRMFEHTILAMGGIVSDLKIEQFNRANATSWKGIRDFLAMHYDCPRRDTPFWQKIAETPHPESYRALKEVFMLRTPRQRDVQDYVMYGWNSAFHLANWVIVAQALGLISPEGCIEDIKRLPQKQVEYINNYFQNMRIEVQEEPEQVYH